MIIRSVELKNIRSYEHEKVEFPEGTVLLSGDIGSGKSSILLAIEFALFGIMRGGLPGSSLLRHGKKKGSVELEIEMEGKDITIYRSLKRQNDNVRQDNGYIIYEDGQKFEGTPVELKAKIIEMIGYPSELVSKSKSLIYRYTVYTPQEEMKQILLEGDESRLDTLRKIFNIDKYKRIKENSALLAREMRSDRKVLKSKLEGFDDTKEKLEGKKEAKSEKEEDKEELEEKIEELKEKTEDAKEKMEKTEEKAEGRKEAEKRYELVRSRINDKEEALEKVEKEAKKLRKDIEELEEELEGKGADRLEEIETRTEELEEDIDENEEKMAKVREKEATRKAQKEQAQKIKKDVQDLDTCPVCRQDVTEDHKEDVIEEQDEKIELFEDKLDKAGIVKNNLKKQLAKYRKELERLREEEKELASVKEKAKRLEEKREKLEEAEDRMEGLGEELEDAREKHEKLEEKLEKTKDVKEELEDAKESHEELRQELNEKKMEHTRLKTEVKGLQESIEELEERVEEMEDARENLKNLNECLEWLDEYFTPTVDVMEKQVMLRIYNEFNEYFVEWFNTLMEDETLNVRLDDKFTPIIDQDGYETTIENLSGGERTSVALAYRLSLNRVINDFISTIKTRDLIILDEPTDGFSTEQLDKVRDVLRELDIRQVIVVSHEAKLETYVEDVIEIAKHNHVSRVTSSTS